jgi:hypothetical protein
MTASATPENYTTLTDVTGPIRESPTESCLHRFGIRQQNTRIENSISNGC